MPEPARPDPRATTQRVKELAKDLAPRVRDLAKDVAQDVADGYRRSTKHMRMRAAVIGGWVVLSLASLWIACPSSSSRPSNELGAKAAVVATSLVGTQIDVANDSEELWTDVTFTLDGTFRHVRRTVRPQERVVLPLSQFKDGGVPAPPDLRPRTLRIDCDEGHVTADLAPEP